MNRIRLFLARMLIGKTKDMFSLKVEVSKISNKIIEDIEASNISDEEINHLVDLMLTHNGGSTEKFKKWSNLVSENLVPESSEEISNFLYRRKWDIAFLSRKEHSSLKQFIDYSGELCTSVIEHKVSEAIDEAEAIANKNNLMLSYLNNLQDDTEH
jgi:hypothetical protein